jgi:carboxypeptidase Taq
MSRDKKMERLREIDRQTQTLGSIVQLLSWDQETGMPPAAVGGRSEQLSLLEGMIHDNVAGMEVGELIGDLCGSSTPSLPPGALVPGAEPDPDSSALLRTMRREHLRAARIPRRLVTEFARAQSRGQAAWISAREENNFASFMPHLQTLLDLNREKADAVGFEEDRYDALLDEYEPWMKASTVDRVFDEMSGSLRSLLDRIMGAPRVDDAFLYADYPVEKQKIFSKQVARAIGFDFSRGSISESAHPFTIRPGEDDVRITTRYNPNSFKSAIFGTIHETGHALYEQGIADALKGTALGQGTSLGIHESQSRTWENMIGRSAEFWQHFYPGLRALFPGNLVGVSRENFVRSVNKVEPSLIRIEADEVTYGLHIILRFRLERELLSGNLPVAELPAAWNNLSEELLGMRPQRDADGVLQDVHWSMGAVGYFPTYALGNLYGAQFYAALKKEEPGLEKSFGTGDFSTVRNWLSSRIYRFGSSRTAEELVTGITGEGLRAKYFADYLETKYTQLYDL